MTHRHDRRKCALWLAKCQTSLTLSRRFLPGVAILAPDDRAAPAHTHGVVSRGRFRIQTPRDGQLHSVNTVPRLLSRAAAPEPPLPSFCKVQCASWTQRQERASGPQQTDRKAVSPSLPYLCRFSLKELLNI